MDMIGNFIHYVPIWKPPPQEKTPILTIVSNIIGSQYGWLCYIALFMLAIIGIKCSINEYLLIRRIRKQQLLAAQIENERRQRMVGDGIGNGEHRAVLSILELNE